MFIFAIAAKIFVLNDGHYSLDVRVNRRKTRPTSRAEKCVPQVWGRRHHISEITMITTIGRDVYAKLQYQPDPIIKVLLDYDHNFIEPYNGSRPKSSRRKVGIISNNSLFNFYIIHVRRKDTLSTKLITRNKKINGMASKKKLTSKETFLFASWIFY